MVKYDYTTGEGSVTPEQATRVNFYNYLASSSQKPRPASETLEVFSKINIFHSKYKGLPSGLSGTAEKHAQWHKRNLVKAVAAEKSNKVTTVDELREKVTSLFYCL